MNRLLICIFSLIISGSLFGQEEQIVVLETEKGNLEGTLLVPKNNFNGKVVLIIAGSGPTDRNGNNTMMENNSLKMLAEGLVENGVASLRYDKRGVGKSQQAGLEESELRFETYVNDAVDWIQWLEKKNSFDEIIIAGHSEGSLIGMLAAQSSDVDAFISIAGAGKSADKIIKGQLAGQPDFVMQTANEIIDQLLKGKTVDSVGQMFYSLFRPSVQPYLISWFKYDPAKEIARLDIPVLIVQGTTDLQVKTEESEILKEAHPEAKKVILEKMNHILKVAEAERQKNIQTYFDPELPLHDQLIESIVSFLDGNG